MSLKTIRPHSLVEQVCESLADFIRQNMTGGASSLPAERKLAEQFGVGRGVIREAIKRLEIQGLLEVRQGSGVKMVEKLHRPLSASLAFLIPDTDERLRQLTEARIAIEPVIAAEAATKARASDLRQLQELHRALLDAESVEAANRHDMEFHRLLAEVAGNEVFRLILESFRDVRREAGERTIAAAGKNVAADHHSTILAAIEAGDGEAASGAMLHHLEEAEKDLRRSKRTKTCHRR